MKTIDQIVKYAYACRFSDSDWERLLAYCRENHTGGRLHRFNKSDTDVTFEEFLKWVDEGFGFGDMVSYGNTVGIIGSSTPKGVSLAAYCDYEGNMIVKDMEVMDPGRLRRLEEKEGGEFMEKLHKREFDFSPRHGIIELYRPKKYFYVILENKSFEESDVGLFLESEGYKYHFAAFLQGGKLKMDCWIERKYAAPRPASEKDIHRLHRATAKAGWTFNARTNTFSKFPRRSIDNAYAYINERFEVALDKDNGSAKHTGRFNAGNYFLDRMEALTFVKALLKLRRGEP